MHKIFGQREKGQYYDRSGAYLVIFSGGKTAVVRTARGLFLLGGGIQGSENDQECIRRECLEECGCECTVKNIWLLRRPSVFTIQKVCFTQYRDIIWGICLTKYRTYGKRSLSDLGRLWRNKRKNVFRYAELGSGNRMEKETQGMDMRKRRDAQLAYISDESVFEEQVVCRRILQKLNFMDRADFDGIAEVVKELLGKSDNAFINPPFYCDYGKNIETGKNFFANYNCTILDVAKVRIGDNCQFAPNVAIYTAGHPVHPDTRNTLYEYGKEVTVGDNVWLGGKYGGMPPGSILETT